MQTRRTKRRYRGASPRTSFVRIGHGLPQTYFHATQTEKLREILRGGIVPQEEGNYPVSRRGDQPKTFLSRSIDEAKRYTDPMHGVGGTYTSRVGAVLEASVPYDIYSQFEPDPIGDVMYCGTIPRRNIVAYHVQNKQGVWIRKALELRTHGMAARGGVRRTQELDEIAQEELERRMSRQDSDALPWTDFARDHERSGEVWRNSRYFVELTRIPVEALEVPVIHLQIESNDHRPIHNWRDFQRIKNEILGSEEEALELYPAESCLVDDRNAYHLWSISGSNNFLTRLLGWGPGARDAEADARAAEDDQVDRFLRGEEVRETEAQQ